MRAELDALRADDHTESERAEFLWKGRAEKAEAELAALRAEVARLEIGLVNQDLLDDRNACIARAERAEAEVAVLVEVRNSIQCFLPTDAAPDDMPTLSMLNLLFKEIVTLRADKAR